MDETIAAYIAAAAALLGIPMDAARAGRVAVHLERTSALAALLQGIELATHDELAEIYSPAAFQPNKYGTRQL